MERPVKLTLQTVALIGVVLLPFAVRYVQVYPGAEPAGSTPATDLLSAGRHAEAYRRLLRSAAEPDEEVDPVVREYQLALCEMALGHAERARGRLVRLAGAEPLLEEYRRFWLAECLEDYAPADSAAAAYGEFVAHSEHAGLMHQARLRLAALRREAHDWDGALEVYAQALAEPGADEPDLLLRLARVHDERRAPADSRRLRLQLAERFPESREALLALDGLPAAESAHELYVRANVLIEHERPGQAAVLLRRITRDYPRHQLTGDAMYLLGRALSQQGQMAAAEQVYAEVYQRYQRPSALYSLGGLQVRQDRDADAIATYERFVRLYPRHSLAPAALWQAAKSAERSSDFEQAETLYRRLAENYPYSEYRDEAGWSIGFMFYCREELDKALVVFRRLSQMSREPHIVDQCLYWAGKTAAQLGRDSDAERYFHRAARGFPRSYYSARAVSMGYADAGVLPQRPHLSGRTGASGDLESVRGALHLRRADALARLGAARWAEHELSQAEADNRSNPRALRLIRDRYEACGMLDRALRLSVTIYLSDEERDEIYRIYPTYYWDQIVRAAQEASVDPYLVLSVIRQESSFNQDAVSRAGALGLMQIMPQTGRTLARSLGLGGFESRQLFDPEVSIRLGSHFLGDQVRQFTEDTGTDLAYELGLAAYNAGPHNARRWLRDLPDGDPDAFVERIPYRETRHYVKLVLKNYTIYKALADV